MNATPKELIECALREAKDFAKDIREYLCEIEKNRSLTERENKLYEKTRRVHIRCEDGIWLLKEWKEEEAKQ